jgi:hypothetical protein
MNNAETIYQNVKAMPMAKAIEDLHFVEFLETKPDSVANNAAGDDLLEFIALLPVGKRIDTKLNKDFQSCKAGANLQHRLWLTASPHGGTASQ